MGKIREMETEMWYVIRTSPMQGSPLRSTLIPVSMAIQTCYLFYGKYAFLMVKDFFGTCVQCCHNNVVKLFLSFDLVYLPLQSVVFTLFYVIGSYCAWG